MTSMVSDGAADLVAETKKGSADGGTAGAPVVGAFKGLGKGLSRFGRKAAAGATAMAGTVGEGITATPAAVEKNAADPSTNTAKVATAASGFGSWALKQGEAFFSDEAPPVGGAAGPPAVAPAAAPAAGPPAVAPAPAPEAGPVDYSAYQHPTPQSFEIRSPDAVAAAEPAAVAEPAAAPPVVAAAAAGELPTAMGAPV